MDNSEQYFEEFDLSKEAFRFFKIEISLNKKS